MHKYTLADGGSKYRPCMFFINPAQNARQWALANALSSPSHKSVPQSLQPTSPQAKVSRSPLSITSCITQELPSYNYYGHFDPIDFIQLRCYNLLQSTNSTICISPTSIYPVPLYIQEMELNLFSSILYSPPCPQRGQECLGRPHLPPPLKTIQLWLLLVHACWSTQWTATAYMNVVNVC